MATTKSTQNTKLSVENFVPCVLLVVCFVLVFVVTTVSVLAQCAMCKTNIAGAENSAEVSRTINIGVLVLLIPTLAIIGGIVRLVLKYRN